MTILGLVGQYGTGALKEIPGGWDILAVTIFSLVIFYYAVSLAMSSEAVKATVERETSYIAAHADDPVH